MQLKSLSKFFKIWYPSFLMMMIIFIMSSFAAADSDRQSGLIINFLTTIFPNINPNGIIIKIVRKSAHFTEFALLGYFTARAFKLSKKSPLCSILACSVYAATDEYHQSFVPGRSAEFKDVAIDIVGASFGVGIYLLSHRKN